MSVPAYPHYKDSGAAWLGTVPSHWDRKPLFALVREMDDRNAGMKEDNLLSLSYGQIKRKNIDDNDGLLPASFETYQIVERDDIIWRLTDLQNDQRSLRTGIVRERGIITSAYLATRPSGIEPAFLAYLLRAYDLTKVFYSMGGGLRQSMKFSDVKWLPVMLPSQAEQSTIASFLDRETAKIDALVMEQERLIALLREKRQAVISDAVTKGLNPDVPMKDSGIEWLGEIPAHWEVRPFKTLVELIDGDRSGAYPSDNDIVDDGIPFLSSKNIREFEFVPDGLRFITQEKFDMLSRGKIVSGDLAITVRGTIGHLALFDSETIGFPTAFINAQMMIIRPKAVGPYFIRYLSQSSYWQTELDVTSYGSAQQQLSNGVLANIAVALPPASERTEIERAMHVATGEIDNLVVEAKTCLRLLRERRAALIAAAVTGKIDVRAQAFQSNVVFIDSARRASNLPTLRAVVGAYAIRELGPMGRMAVMKAGYLAEGHAGFCDLNGRYERYAAGPYDQSLIGAMERGAEEICAIVTNEPQDEGKPVTYDVPKSCQPPSDALSALVGQDRAQRFLALLSLLKGIGRDGVEAAATLYAVWNDLLAASKAADDDAICNGVLNDWHPEKAKKFKRADLDHWLDWMRRNGLVPDGSAPRTDNQGILFA